MRADLVGACLFGASFEGLILLRPDSACPSPLVATALAVHLVLLLILLAPSAPRPPIPFPRA